jgi:crotonobetainyl-CoA:carnitine CoA-transferase CaiB-like acyl-CoA transferase
MEETMQRLQHQRLQQQRLGQREHTGGDSREEQQMQPYGGWEPAGGRPRHEAMGGQQQWQRPQPMSAQRSALSPVDTAGQQNDWPAEERRRQARPTQEEAWVVYEQRRAEWLQYYIECGDVDRALDLCLTPRERARVLSASQVRMPWLSPQGPEDGLNEALHSKDGRGRTGAVEAASAGSGAQQPVRSRGTPPACNLYSI